MIVSDLMVPVAESWKQHPDTTTTCVGEKRRDKMAHRECALELRLFPYDQTQEGITAERIMLGQRWRLSCGKLRQHREKQSASPCNSTLIL